MPHTKSAAKRLRKSEKRRRRNKMWVKAVKKQTRAFAETLTGTDAAAQTPALVAAQKTLDKAAAKGVIHKNKAARMKSRLSRKLNAAKAAPAKPAGKA